MVALAFIAAGPPAGAAESRRVTLLHTSDLHGRVLPWDDVRAEPARGSLAQVATVVDRVRATADGPVLVLDSGDAIQGTPLELYEHVLWARPSPTIAAMNLIGYDAMAVGNHELNFGLDVLRRAERQARFPLLSANILHTADGEPAFPPFTVIEREGLRVGVLGLITPAVPQWERPEHYPGLEFESPVEAARRWVEILRRAERCDLVVVLAHTGLERDPETGEPTGTAHEDWAWRLAAVDGVDVLLIGHSHRAIPPRLVAGAVVAQPSSHGRAVTRIDLELTATEDVWHVSGFDGEIVAVGDETADRRLLEALAPARKRVVEALAQPVGEVTAPVTVAGCRLADCAAVDLVHAVQLAASGADVSLASLLSDRTPDLAAGPVTWRWVHGLYVYPNTLVAVRLSGGQLVAVLEHAARFYDGLDCSPANGCTVLVDPDIPGYNVDSAAGVSYRIDPTRPEGRRVREVRFRGLPLDCEEEVVVVVNSYRATGGGGFPHLAEAPVVWRSEKEVAQLIGEHLRKAGSWQPVVDGNWFIGQTMSGSRPAQ